MRTLIIETSTERGLIAFTNDAQVLYEKELPFGYNQSKFLMPELKTLVQACHLSSQSLDCISVGIGPGSYTGIRVGVSVAKTLAYAWQLPLIGISSLYAFVPREKGVFVALIDAKIGGAYLLKGHFDGHEIQEISESQVVSLEQLDHHLKDAEVIVTPSAKMLKNKIDRIYPSNRWEWEEVSPSAKHLAQAVNKKYESGDWSLNTALELLYLRKTEAELEKERKLSE